MSDNKDIKALFSLYFHSKYNRSPIIVETKEDVEVLYKLKLKPDAVYNSYYNAISLLIDDMNRDLLNYISTTSGNELEFSIGSEDVMIRYKQEVESTNDSFDLGNNQGEV